MFELKHIKTKDILNYVSTNKKNIEQQKKCYLNKTNKTNTLNKNEYGIYKQNE